MRGGIAISITMLCGCGARSELDVPELPPDPPCTESFGALAAERCDPVEARDASAGFESLGPVWIASFGCDGVAVFTAGAAGSGVHVSSDGGASFGPPRLMPDDALIPHRGSPQNAPIAVSGDGTIFVLVEEGERLAVRRSDDFGETWEPPVDAGETHERAWGASLLARGDEVTSYWLVMGEGPALARSRDRGESFEAPIALGPGIVESSHSYPTVCHAGASGIVAGWLDCTAPDCSGMDRMGTGLGRIAVSSGGAFRDGVVFEVDDSSWNRPVVGCSDGGRALAGWSSAPYLGSGELVVASIDACGRATETFRHDGGADRHNAPGSPMFSAGGDGALMRWRLEWNFGSGVAALDEQSELAAAVIDPDYDGDGMLELPVDSCALQEGYAVIALTARPRGGGAWESGGDLVLAHLGADAAAIEVRLLGPLADYRAGWLDCDPRGRAHVLWQGASGASYASIAF